MTRPGPVWPRRKTTIRSYCWTTRTDRYEHEQDDDEQRRRRRSRRCPTTRPFPRLARLLARRAAPSMVSTISVSPSWPTTRTGVPRSSGRSSARARGPLLAASIDRPDRRQRPRTSAERVRRQRRRRPGRAPSGDVRRARTRDARRRANMNTPPSARPSAAMTGHATLHVGRRWACRAPCTARPRPARSRRCPPIVSRPWLVTVSSRTNRTTPRPISSSPAMLSGRLPKPMNARMIADAADDAGHEVRVAELEEQAVEARA